MKINKSSLVKLILSLIVFINSSLRLEAADPALNDFINIYSAIFRPAASVATGAAIEWDFNNDGVVDSTTSESAYVFPGPGSYPVKMKSTSAAGINTTSKTITIGEQVSAPVVVPSKIWLDAAWKYRVKITVQPAQIKASLAEFPLYLDLSTLAATFFAKVKADGSDIRVTKSDMKTEVPVQLVSINNTSKTGELYFKAPTLSATENVFYIYYGNPAATAVAIDSSYGAKNVWAAAYAAVWHLHDDPSKTAPQIKDSTIKNINGTAHTSMTATNLSPGKIGQGLNFDGADDVIRVGDNLYYSETNTFTYSCWAKTTAIGARTMMAKGTNSSPYTGINFFNYDGKLRLSMVPDLGVGPSIWKESTAVINDNKWHHLVATYDGSKTNAGIKLYVDGIASTAAGTGTWGGTMPRGYLFNIGERNGGINWLGQLDECRVSSSALSPEWILAEFNNQNSSASFYSLSTEEVY